MKIELHKGIGNFTPYLTTDADRLSKRATIVHSFNKYSNDTLLRAKKFVNYSSKPLIFNNLNNLSQDSNLDNLKGLMVWTTVSPFTFLRN